MPIRDVIATSNWSSANLPRLRHKTTQDLLRNGKNQLVKTLCGASLLNPMDATGYSDKQTDGSVWSIPCQRCALKAEEAEHAA